MAIPDYKTGIKLVYDNFSWEGEVVIKNNFYKAGTLMRLDVLKDWSHEIDVMYEEALEEWKQEMDEIREKANAERDNKVVEETEAE